ncbi:PucR family transcriptional regulator [Mycolicibacterium tokaiense]|uniref:Regulatory protein n=1 Tax=Mycolicibacterium tokaiense TaxID=39695 RepID=A0A378TNM4_9MYCO|nr:PucR family transcriptional regulator [Mycolicibacterium tokaiense]BBY84266.1 putative regulatory protein [Mycolicibacterium tokaiense]STZ61226.1 Putative regulatory protein [Mycolicibacterium tokaiense]
MTLTIADILDLPVLRAGDPEVIGGGALDRPVRWVHVSDIADLSNLLEGGELVLTTGAALFEPDYLPRLAAAGAVAVVVELGRHVTEIPPAMATAELPLPVIALHREVRFVEVTEEVHRRIVAEQYAEVDYARRVHEAFTALSMRRATVEDIVAACADMLDTAVVLEDLNRQVLAFDARGTRTADLLRDWDRRSRLAGAEWLSRGVGPYRQEWGRLIAPLAEATSRAAMTVERAAQALALHHMAEQGRTSLELRAQSGLVDDLRAHRVADEAEATSRAYALGLRPALTYVPMTLRPLEIRNNDQVLTQRRRAAVLDAMVSTVRAEGHTVLTASREDGQIDVLLAPRRGVPLSRICDHLRRAVERVDGISGCVIGVGPESARLIDAADGLAESVYVAEVAAGLPDPRRSFYRAADVRLRGLVALIRSDPRVQAFAETELRGVLEYRAKHDDSAFELLRVFLECGGNKTEVAGRLRLSRPTLYARLAALQRLLGVDLDDAESRTSLHVALLILDRHDTPPDGSAVLR